MLGDLGTMIPILEVHAYIYHFFFSSRRRHTRSLCDWSSDVCSSDLQVSDEILRDRASQSFCLLLLGSRFDCADYLFSGFAYGSINYPKWLLCSYLCSVKRFTRLIQ